MTWDEFMALQELSASFPVVFQSGAQWEIFTGFCAGCNYEIEPEMLRGHVEQFYGYREPSETRFLHAHGYCEKCQKLTEYQYYLHADLTLEGRDRRGQWGIFERKRSMWQRFRSWW